MKATVARKFFDRLNPSDIYEVGDVFEGDEARIAELAAGGWVEPIVEKKPAAKKPKARKK